MYSDNHLSRRRAKTLYEYLKLLENSKEKIDLLQIFFHLLKINFLPSELKTKFEKSRNFSNEDISELKSCLEKKLLRTEKSKQENLIEDFNDYVSKQTETDANGNQTVRSFPGRQILGYYKKDRDVTTDFYGRIISRGNTAIALIYKDKK